MNTRIPSLSLSLLSCVAATCMFSSLAQAQLVVSTDLGTIGATSSTNVTGNTAIGGANNCDYYNPNDAGAYWGLELVYGFTVDDAFTLTLSANSIVGDPDFYLLDGLEIGADANGRFATGLVALAYMDDVPAQPVTFGTFPPGTYYLVADSYNAGDPNGTATATFDMTLIMEEFIYPKIDPVDLGILPALPGEVFTIDSVGSSFDTELGVYDSIGNPIGFNDDIDFTVENYQSEIEFETGLDAGTYRVALGSFNTLFSGEDFAGTNFEVLPGGSQAGLFNFNYPGGSVNETLADDSTQWFQFTIAEPVPLVFTEIDSDGVNTTLTWDSIPGKTYSVDGSPDMFLWTNIDDGVGSGGDSTTYTDTTGVKGTTTFYFRVRENQ